MNSKKWSKRAILFIVGFLVYMAIEVIWAAKNGALADYEGKKYLSLCGYTSVWMGLVGGILFLFLGKLNEIPVVRKKLPLSLQCLLGSIIITLLEFISGLILNVWLKLDIWDYTGRPLAHIFLNQINLYHSLLWYFLSIFAFWLDDALRWVLYELKAVDSCNKIYNLFWLFIQLFRLKPPKVTRLKR